jgi:FdhE protein
MEDIYQQYRAALPKKTRFIDLAWEVWRLQEQAAPPPPVTPLEETLAAQLLGSGKALAVAGLELPAPACSGLFADLVDLFDHAGLLPSTGRALVDFWQSLPPAQWLYPDEATLKELTRLAITLRIVLFVARQALAPFYRQEALPYQDWLSTAPWGRGVCPFCGQEPVLARLAQDVGRRFLYCGLCGSQWTFVRLTCPFCGNHDQKQLSYLHQDHDPSRRLDLCRKCARYIKTVDERRLRVPLHLPLEEFITLDLDHLANLRGFH